MCVVSMVMDMGKDQWPGLVPAYPAPWVPVQNPMPVTPVVPADFLKEIDLGGVKKKAAEEAARKEAEGRLPTKAEIEAFLKLVQAAEEFDKKANQPHCEDPEKIKVLKAIEERLATLEKEILGRQAEENKAALLGSSCLASQFTVGDKTITLGELVAEAHRFSNLAVYEWNRLPEDNRERRLLDTLLGMRELARKAT